eukprot:TRINITY_DN16880_c0_g1_i1.p1 TRINITY_DN16880_c0_g1~~TRINITY_DN16880_c0_g1_i1.p1  ORF type:complete len:282 (+),score=50.16 TRINITY_DN16880_c0_g1_i1:130-975(+)
MRSVNDPRLDGDPTRGSAKAPLLADDDGHDDGIDVERACLLLPSGPGAAPSPEQDEKHETWRIPFRSIDDPGWSLGGLDRGGVDADGESARSVYRNDGGDDELAPLVQKEEMLGPCPSRETLAVLPTHITLLVILWLSVREMYALAAAASQFQLLPDEDGVGPLLWRWLRQRGGMLLRDFRDWRRNGDEARSLEEGRGGLRSSSVRRFLADHRQISAQDSDLQYHFGFEGRRTRFNDMASICAGLSQVFAAVTIVCCSVGLAGFFAVSILRLLRGFLSNAR